MSLIAMKLLISITTLVCATFARPDGIYITINKQGSVGETVSLDQAKPTFRADYENHGIGFYKYHRVPQRWGKARQICEAEGAHLAIVNTDLESQLLVAMMNKYPANVLNDVVHKDYILLGFHDLFIEGEYLTLKDRPLASSGFVRWNTGQPDNAGGNENCGSLHRSGALNDFPCNLPSTFICEKEIQYFDVY